jgi:hypothetical protein
MVGHGFSLARWSRSGLASGMPYEVVVRMSKERMMFDRIAKVDQWVSIPQLLLAAPFRPQPVAAL